MEAYEKYSSDTRTDTPMISYYHSGTQLNSKIGAVDLTSHVLLLYPKIISITIRCSMQLLGHRIHCRLFDILTGSVCFESRQYGKGEHSLQNRICTSMIMNNLIVYSQEIAHNIAQWSS